MTPTPKRGAEFYKFEGVLAGNIAHKSRIIWCANTFFDPENGSAKTWYRRTDIKWCLKYTRFGYATFLHILKMCRMAETSQFFSKYFAGHFLSVIFYNINYITYTTQTRFALVIMTIKKGTLRTSSKVSSTCSQIFQKTEIFVSVAE